MDRPPLQRTRLDHSVYSLVLVALYATLMVFAWVVLCIIAHRPIMSSMNHYGASFDDNGSYNGGSRSIYSIFTRSDRYLQAAQSVRSATTLVTIPLISTICSKAAVVVTQRRRRQTMSLRQTMTLADRGWTDPTVYFRLLSGGFKQYATKFLVLAIFLNILGGIIAPLQSFYLSTTIVKRPTSVDDVSDLADILDFTEPTQKTNTNSQEIVLRTRIALTATNNVATQGRL
ncbi:hypothetical protein WHR41_08048 [Cladosporium halotolerans]|uniref:Uncharacterized protein n=1 Tax=Cladosporium halotolerans TaxID=1052096 RepID=A0AB34KDS1_9PEZI